MQDGTYNDSDDEREAQTNLDDEQSEEEEIFQPVDPDSAIREAIKNMKKELSSQISTESISINEKIKKFPIIPLGKLSTFLLKFVKKANLSFINRRILFAAITPIHHIYLYIINNSHYKNTTIRSSFFSEPYEPNSLKKCFDYFIKVFNLIQYDLQQINETLFIEKLQSIVDNLKSTGQEDFNQIEKDVDENIQSIIHNFEKLHQSQSVNKLSYKHISRCKVDLKRFKITVLPFFKEDDKDPLKNDFLSYYNNFYSEIRNFELFYKVNWIINQFKQNWDQPLFWFLPCQMAKVNSDTVFDSAVEYLYTFWTTCDLNNIFKSLNGKGETAETVETVEPENGGKSDNENGNAATSNNSENCDSEDDSIDNPELFRIKMTDVLDLLSFKNKLEPQRINDIARSFMGEVNKYNSYFNLNSTMTPANFDIENIKTIISAVCALPHTMKDSACNFNNFLNERLKLLKQYMYIYNSESNHRSKFNRKGYRGSNFNSLISNSSISSTSSTSRFAQQILCNATFNEIFAYIHSFVTFASDSKENPILYPLIKNEIHKLICFYSEILLKTQMVNDSKTLASEALQRAKQYEMDNLKSLKSCREITDKSNEDGEIYVDLFQALKELAISTRRVLRTNFIKDEKRDLMERFYTFLQICCPYFQNLKQQQLKAEHKIDMHEMKELLSTAFPLFDTQDIFRFESQNNIEEIQIGHQEKETNDESNSKSEEVEKYLHHVWTNENKELLFNKYFPSVREKARNLQIGVSDDWRSVFEFKTIYKTFCRLFIVEKPTIPLNENPTEFEQDIHKFFSVATQFVMDDNFSIRETIIPLSTIIDQCRSLSIKWMFSNPSKIVKSMQNETENEKDKETSEQNEDENDSEVTQKDKQHWDYSSLLFGIAFISVPHPIQTISIFLMIMSSREKVMESEGRQLSAFKDLFNSFLENFNCEKTDAFVKSSQVQSCLSVFENDIDFFFSSEQNGTKCMEKQNIRQIINEINQVKEKYMNLSSLMTMMNEKYFDRPDSYSRLFVEIAFFANILKSFKDTLEILKRFDLLLAPSDSDLGSNYTSLLNSTWPFSPGFLDLDMYKNDLPGFLLSLHSSISRLSVLKPNFMIIRRTFDFYMNIALSSFSFCFSSFNQFPLDQQSKEEFIVSEQGSLESNQFFSWNKSNYDSSSKTKALHEQKNDEDDEFDDIFNNHQEKMNLNSEKLNKSQHQYIDEIKVHYHALAVLYSQYNDHPSILLCCEVLARTTSLIKLLNEAGLSDFNFLSIILSDLSEAIFAIINAINIKKEVDKIINSVIYFASLFGIKLSKSQKNSQAQSTASTPNSSQQTTSVFHSTPPQIKKKKVHHNKKRRKLMKMKNSDSNIPSLSDFHSISQSIDSALPVFERMAETIPQDQPEIQHFYRARSLFNSIQGSLDQIKIPTTSEQFKELINQSNQRMEMLQNHIKMHQKRIHTKIDNCDSKFKKMESLIESDYSCITQKIEDETIKGEQLDEDIANARAELKRRNRIKQTNENSHSKINKKKAKTEKIEMTTNSNSQENVLNFNFNFDSSSSNKPIARAQLIMAQAQELQKQNNLIQIQLQRNELEQSILNSIEKNKDYEKDAVNFVKNETTINDVVQNIMKNASDVLVPESQQKKPQFDPDEDEKPSNVLSKNSIYAIMEEIIQWDEQQQNITTIDHNELCDKVELLAYSLINGTKNKENEMIKLQNQLKNVKSAQKDKLLKLRNILNDVDLDEE